MEVLQTMQDDSSSDSEDSDKSAETFEECVLPIHAIPQPAQPLKRKRTMRLRGWRGKQDLPILLDSSSAGTFVSEVVAQQCQSQMQDTNSSQFTTADGSPIISDKIIIGFQWFIQGHYFSYDTRVLPLKCFDMIIGADWLEDHSLTWIHWKKKVMRCPFNGTTVKLHGITDNTSSCKAISVRKLNGILRNHSFTLC
jgi:hypothetical protein